MRRFKGPRSHNYTPSRCQGHSSLHNPPVFGGRSRLTRAVEWAEWLGSAGRVILEKWDISLAQPKVCQQLGVHLAPVFQLGLIRAGLHEDRLDHARHVQLPRLAPRVENQLSEACELV
eukprot:scaffold4545_cov111-Isochrysis_galbana.AAC.14